MKLKTLILTLLIALTINPVAYSADAVIGGDARKEPVKSSMMGGGALMILMMIGGSLESIGRTYSTLVCSKMTANIQSCKSNTSELTHVQTFCLGAQPSQKGEQLQAAVKHVRDRYNELKQLYESKKGSFSTCYTHVQELGVCLKDFDTKLKVVETVCK